MSRERYLCGHSCAAENVGAIAITGVASRRVTQTGAVVMLFLGLIGEHRAHVQIPGRR
jgi:xanthine/uracil permease